MNALKCQNSDAFFMSHCQSQIQVVFVFMKWRYWSVLHFKANNKEGEYLITANANDISGKFEKMYRKMLTAPT